MMTPKLRKRIKNYLDLCSRLSEIKTDEIRGFLKKGALKKGWGSNHLIKIGGHKVFVKKIPLTKLEHENSFDTKNLYRLPLFYNYGVGSAGFGAFRELVTHIKTTNWVLDGEIQNFPLMFHYRILPRFERPQKIDAIKHKKYIKKWNDSKTIDKYIRERSKADYEVVLFLEYFPHTLDPWFRSNTELIQSVSQQMYETLGFLKNKGVIHFDAHLYNILSDGQTVYLSDFGLALDKKFSLSKGEKEFWGRHGLYDFGEFIGNIGFNLEAEYRGFSQAKKKAIDKKVGSISDLEWVHRQEFFLSNLDFLRKLNLFSLEKNYLNFLKKNRDVILLSNNFFFELSGNPKKDTKFEAARLKRYLVRDSIC